MKSRVISMILAFVMFIGTTNVTAVDFAADTLTQPIDVYALIAQSDERAIVTCDLISGEVTLNEMPPEPDTYTPDNLHTAQDVITNERQYFFGNDNRKQITNTNAHPYITTVFVTATFPSGNSFTGSGSFVGATTVLTAGHVIYARDQGGWATSVKVEPGGSSSNRSAIPGTSMATSSGWINIEDFDYDYGVIRIAANAGVGWFGMSVLSDSRLSGQDIVRYGYDGDKPRGTLWVDSSSKIAEVTSRSLHHHAASFSGSSGGGVALSSDPAKLVGIHVAATSINGVPAYNRAVRVTSDVVAFVNQNRARCDTAEHRYSAWRTVNTATCSSVGLRERDCRDCGLRETDSTNASGHQWGAGIIAGMRTCTMSATEMKTCMKCGYAEVKTLAAFGHDWSVWVEITPSTIEQKGVMERTCGRCNLAENREIARLVEPFSAGDVNGDGKITIADALLVLRYLVKLSTPILTDDDARFAACIIDPDSGEPKMADALAILRRVVMLPGALDIFHPL
ncbi:MAG: trypsin-like peptidase domain-containing protein [Oscillospiraceae bacterium]|nr:trypsin-like peptidase domain-containing protein [Oscillospiraceae bacterium]